MKTNKTIATIATTLTLILALSLSSCKKGDTGPAGPTGATGASGVANIQSGTVTTNNSTWGFDATDNSYNATLTYAAITQAVVERGTVQVFISDGTGAEWLSLPFSYGTKQYNYSYKLGQVLISVTLSTGGSAGNPGGQQFKVVVIPPAAKAPNTTGNQSNESVSQVFKVVG